MDSKATLVDKRGLSMEEACTYIGGVSRPTMYKLIGQDEIESYYIGVRRYFTKDSLDHWINNRLGLWPQEMESGEHLG
jgi:excisionase family DNA binding protein